MGKGDSSWYQDAAFLPGADSTDWLSGQLGLGGDSTDPFGDAAAARKQEEYARWAMRQQLGEAEKGRDFLRDQAEQGYGFIDRGAGRATGAIDAYSDRARGDLYGGRNAGIDAYQAARGRTMDDLYGGASLARQDYAQGIRSARGMYDGFEADPGYQFRLQQGQDQIQRAASAAGGRLSGRTLQAMQNYSQDLASQEFGNYAQRAATQEGFEQQNRQAMAGLRAQAGAMGAGYENQYGANLANAYMGTGQLGAQMRQQTGQNMADIYMNQGTAKANAALGVGSGGMGLSQAAMQAYGGPTQYAGGAQQAQANTKKMFGELALNYFTYGGYGAAQGGGGGSYSL